MKLTGSHIKIASELLKHQDKIQKGTMLSIDPGSTSPGWALWMLGRLVDSGSFQAKGGIAERLAQIHDFIEGLPTPDILIIEKIGMIRGGGKAQAHRYLFWSLGSLAGATRAKVLIEIPQNLWSKFRDRTYTKSDEEDAIMLGRCAIELTR